MRKALPVLFILILVSGYSYSQLSPTLLRLQAYLEKNTPPGFDKEESFFKNNGKKGVHYLYPVYTLLLNEEKSKKVYSNAGYYDNASQMLSFTTDYKTALDLSVKGYDSINAEGKKSIVDYADSLKNIQYVDARSFILDLAKKQRVVMINEAHNKPLHRAFTYSLLEDMYKGGFRYLAMEAFNNNPKAIQTQVSAKRNHYLNEPVSAELVRKALELGYTLVPYEDSASYRHSGTQRDSVQAANLFAIIKKDPQAKILVHAGYGHIYEEAFSNGYIPMALAFKKLSGIDPLTIDQTEMTEGSGYEYGRIFYDSYIKKNPVQSASIAFQKNKPVNLLYSTGYDLAIIHPQTTYLHGRATWYNLNGTRKEVAIKPTERNLFMVQAYYLSEYDETDLGDDVPADQTYVSADDGYYYLYLKPGRYKLVLRDMGYTVLAVKDLEVQ